MAFRVPPPRAATGAMDGGRIERVAREAFGFDDARVEAWRL